MQLIRNLSQLTSQQQGGAVAIGNFDGVHRGHARLIERLIEQARTVAGPAVVFTFDPHPLRVLRVLRAENREHHWGNGHAAEVRGEDGAGQGGLAGSLASNMQLSRAKRDFLEAFCPRSAKWRERVLAQGFDLIERTVRGLQAGTDAI